jgi:hypothetical protein
MKYVIIEGLFLQTFLFLYSCDRKDSHSDTDDALTNVLYPVGQAIIQTILQSFDS